VLYSIYLPLTPEKTPPLLRCNNVSGKSCLDTIREHVTIWKFKPEPLPEEHVHLTMETGRRAPTDAALHLWTAVRVTDREKRRIISDAIGQPHVYEAAEFFVFLADLYRLEKLLEYRGEKLGDADFALLLFTAIDAGIAAESMALAVREPRLRDMLYRGCAEQSRNNNRSPRPALRTYPLFGLAIDIPNESLPGAPDTAGHFIS
jgi:FMN reductase (NADPH)